ncbi:MAG: prepilin-type cleavage/methylation domain-containing protein, partial [Candidatus Methylumidiphilus alinenensis]
MKSRSAIGFTLIELMVTITMIAIVLTVGVPSFQSSIRNSVLTAGINEFIAALNFAR